MRHPHGWLACCEINHSRCSGPRNQLKASLRLVTFQFLPPFIIVTRTHSLNPSPELNVTGFSLHSLTPTEKVDLALNIIKLSSLIQSMPPWIAWHRPLSWLTSPTQDWTESLNLPLFYNTNSDVTPTQTNLLSHRQLWLVQCSGNFKCSQTPHHPTKLSANYLLELSSLQCAPVNTSKSLDIIKRNFFRSETFDSSKEKGSLNIQTHYCIWLIVCQLHLNFKKGMQKWYNNPTQNN